MDLAFDSSGRLNVAGLMEEESEDIYHLVGSTGGGQLYINLTSDHLQDRDSSYSTQRLIVHTEGEELKTGPQPVRETVFSTEICSVDTDQQENGATILFDDIGKIIFQ